MKKLILLLAICLQWVTYLYAQTPYFAWAKRINGAGIASIALDKSGNFYVTGAFGGTVDFDPGDGVYNLSSIGDADIYAAKYDASGNLIWVKSMGGKGIWETLHGGTSIALDESGNVYITGHFEETVDFDPGPGVFKLTSVNGSWDIFVVKLDASGGLVWAKSIEGTSGDSGYGISVDASGSVYVTGRFQEVADFDPGIGVYNLTALGSYDIFITKLNASGNFVWAQSMGSSDDDEGQSIAVDKSGNVYTSGYFGYTVDFNGTTGVYNLTAENSRDIFITKQDASGNLIWAKSVEGNSANSMVLDESGNIYIGGQSSYSNIFITKLDALGNLTWAKSMESTDNDREASAQSIAVDKDGNVYATGRFARTVDFDPNAGTFNLTSHEGWDWDIFISKLDALGNMVWAKNMGGTNHDWGNTITVDASGYIYTTGSFYGTVDFDPGAATFNLIDGGTFIQKLSNQCLPPAAPTANDKATCMGSTASLTAMGYGVLGWYSAPIGGTYLGGGTNFTTQILNADAIYYVQDSICMASATRTAVKVTITSDPLPTISVTGTTAVCKGSQTSLTASGAISYLWSTNGTSATEIVNPTTTTIYSVMGTDAKGCSSKGQIKVRVSECSQDEKSPVLQWANRVGNTSDNYGRSIAIDDLGNVYTVGNFRGTMDLDPGAGVFNRTASGNTDMFITKLDISGNFVWSKVIGATGTSDELPASIKTDRNGNVYIMGYFSTTVDFDPGAGVVNLTSAGSTDIFILKLNSSGDLVWAKKMGGTLDDAGASISIDDSGNIYATGYFNSTVDFDPNGGTYNLTSKGSYDVFVVKLSESGNLIWAKNMGGTNFDSGACISVDNFGNVYIVGSFSLIADFDPNAGSYNLTSVGGREIFIVKLDGMGNLIWAKSMGGTGDDSIKSIVVDKSGDIYITGSFNGTSDFDPGVNTFNLKSAGSTDIYFASLDEWGNFLWAKRMGAYSNDDPSSLAIDESGYIYASGQFIGTVDFDPNAGVYNLSANGSDIFNIKLDAFGNLIWANKIGGSNSDYSGSIAIDKLHNFYSIGFFSSTVDFDPNAGVYNLSATGTSDIYMLKLGECRVSSPLAIGTEICSGSSANITASGIGKLGWYSASTGGNYLGGGPNYSTPMLVTESTFYVQDSTCAASSRTAVSVTFMPAPTVKITGATSICDGTSTTLTASGATSYTWSTTEIAESQTISPLETTSYSVTGTGDNGCSTTVSQVVTVNDLPTVTIAGTTAICEGESTTLTASGASSYSWSTTNSSITETVSPPVTTLYTVTGKDDNGCEDTEEITITVNPLPNITIEGKSVICEGESTTLTASGATSYLWSTDGSTETETVTPTAETLYTVTGKDENGCEDSEDITVTVNVCTDISDAIFSSMSLNPNPTNGEFVINTTTIADNIIVCNALGNRVAECKPTSFKTTININQFDSGVYFVRIVSGEKSTVTKVVKY